MAEKEKSKFDKAVAELEKRYGKGTVMGASQKGIEVDVVGTGSLTLDIATGINGLPYGRVVEILAPESSGKTTLCLHIIKNVQKQGKKAVFIDTEHALDLAYAKALGVDLDQLVISQPDYGEQAFEIGRALAESGEVGVIVFDSVAAMVPKGEIDGEIGDASMARQARMMSQALRILVSVFERNNVLVVFTNQIRMKIGGYGNPEVGTGGEALKFYASIRIDMRKSSDVDAQGNVTRVKIMKNKLAPPYQTANFFIDWGKGINRMREVVDLAVKFGIIPKSGSWYTVEGNKLQGEEAVIQLLQDNPELAQKMEEMVLEEMKSKPIEIEVEETID